MIYKASATKNRKLQARFRNPCRPLCFSKNQNIYILTTMSRNFFPSNIFQHSFLVQNAEVTNKGNHWQQY